MTGTGPGLLAAAHPIHRALVYRDVDEFVTLTARVIHGALAAGQPVLAALPTTHLRLVREALQSDGGDVRWIDMSAEGRNPGRILPAVLTAFEDEHAGATVTMIGEPIWPGRNANEYAAALAHEALINVAFAGHELSVVCPYDAAGLTPDAMHDAHRTHPEILDRRGTRASEDYGDPVAVAAEATARLSDPSPEAVVLQVNQVDEVRPPVRSCATRRPAWVSARTALTGSCWPLMRRSPTP